MINVGSKYKNNLQFLKRTDNGIRITRSRSAKIIKQNNKDKQNFEISDTENFNGDKLNRQESEMAEYLNIESLVNTLPKYDGKAECNIAHFVDQFDQLVEGTKLNDKQKLVILKAKISGKARDILHANEELINEKDYGKFKENLITELKQKLSFDEAQEKFLNMKQMPLESIEDFVKNFNKTAKAYLQQSGQEGKEGANQFLQTIKFTRFLEAIRPDIAYEIRKTGTRNFDEAVKIALTIEKAMNYQKQEELNTVQNNKQENQFFNNLMKINDTQAQQIDSLKEEIMKMKISQNEKQTKYKFCTICKRQSHNIEQCWFNSQNQFNHGNRVPNISYDKPRYYEPQQQNFKTYNYRQNKFQQRPGNYNKYYMAGNNLDGKKENYGYFQQQQPNFSNTEYDRYHQGNSFRHPNHNNQTQNHSRYQNQTNGNQGNE